MSSIIIAKQCEKIFDLSKAELAEEYFYQSLPLCVIDAVFSIGIRYSTTQNVVSRYCEYFNLQRARDKRESIPTTNTQQSITDFIIKMDELGLEYFTYNVFRNKNRTSPKNGILKTQAVYEFAKVLKDYGVNNLQDVPNILLSLGFENQIKAISGQSSGISLKYFFMLAGEKDFIKPDRWILDFLETVTGFSVSPKDAEILLREASRILEEKYPNISPRLLDYQIWNYQRTIPNTKRARRTPLYQHFSCC